MHVLSVSYAETLSGLSRHYHDCHQILYIRSGTIRATVGGETCLVSDGGLLILSRFETHAIEVLSTDYCRYALRISSAASQGVQENDLLASVLVNRAEDFRHAVDTAEARPAFDALFADLTAEYTAQGALCAEMLDLGLRRLLILLYRCAPELFLRESGQNTVVVQAIQRRFEANYAAEHSLADLAAEYHLSPSHLSHIFKRITGYAPMEYLTACRLSAAKSLLTTTNTPVKEIVFRCGFSDESNFCRMFKARTGLTPRAFRKQYQPM